MLANLGIIAGNGALPAQIAKQYIASGGNCFIAAIDDQTKFNDLQHECFTIGRVGSILKYFKQNSVKNIIIIGGIKRPDFKSIQVDLSGAILLAKILKQKILGDDNVLRIVANYLEEKDFKIVSPKQVMNLSNYEYNIFSKTRPSPRDRDDIQIGSDLIKAIGSFDVGQSVIVSDGYVVGIEAAEGTDNLIKRCQKLRNKSTKGVLVKMTKPTQDMRFDIPTIGSETILLLAKNGFSGIAIEQKNMMIVDPEKVINLLNEHGLFLEFIHH